MLGAGITFRALKRLEMERNNPSCIRCVGESICIKNGTCRLGKQRYLCKSCKTSFIVNYSYKAYNSSTTKNLITLLKEGCGIRSISRILEISTTTVLKRILEIASKVVKPTVALGRVYEMDELCTYVGKKQNFVWVAYAIRKDTREVVDFVVGKRTKRTLKKVIDLLILSNANRIHTDKLKSYSSLIPSNIHSTKVRGTNYIERLNLTLRTHLKRLNRRTITYSKSGSILEAILKIYFWSY
jgi:IS1 family transposase/transposase-like protein